MSKSPLDPIDRALLWVGVILCAAFTAMIVVHLLRSAEVLP